MYNDFYLPDGLIEELKEFCSEENINNGVIYPEIMAMSELYERAEGSGAAFRIIAVRVPDNI